MFNFLNQTNSDKDLKSSPSLLQVKSNPSLLSFKDTSNNNLIASNASLSSSFHSKRSSKIS